MDRCDTCDYKFRPIPGYGPEPCEILFIGDRPGLESLSDGRPLAGKVGKEFDLTYLWQAGLRRDDVRTTNVVKCPVAGKRKTQDKEVTACSAAHLREEIRECEPSLIVLMGAVACSLVPDIELDMQHGFPQIGKVMDWEGPIIPMYHPAMGIRDTSQMTHLLHDFARMKQIIAGEWAFPDNPYPVTDYGLIESPNDFLTYVDTMNACVYSAIDTETHGPEPFSLQFSHTPGTARMILAPNKPVIRMFNEWAGITSAEFILHQAGGDLDTLDRMGVSVPNWRDTMQECFHQGDLPQGLKALIYRQLGIRMRTWIDVVKPHSRRAITEWMENAQIVAESELQVTTYKQLKTKLKTIVKPGEVEGALKRIIRYTASSPKYDPWEKLAEMWEKRPATEHSLVTEYAGIPPILGIGNVPLDEAVEYGCSDADFTLRGELMLEERRDELMTGPWNVPDEDRDQ